VIRHLGGRAYAAESGKRAPSRPGSSLHPGSHAAPVRHDRGYYGFEIA
jgi:hypothetical protein